MGKEEPAKEEAEVKEEVSADIPQEEEEDKGPPKPLEYVTICIVFDYQKEHWSHKFQVVKDSSVLDLKKLMVKPSSPPDDVFSFDLNKRRLRVSNLDELDCDD